MLERDPPHDGPHPWCARRATGLITRPRRAPKPRDRAYLGVAVTALTTTSKCPPTGIGSILRLFSSAVMMTCWRQVVVLGLVAYQQNEYRPGTLGSGAGAV
jgi:hypothetical protein